MAGFLPMTKKEVARRGWDILDIILITGDAYVDHPSYGTAVIGRVLEKAGYSVGIISQPDWRSAEDFIQLGRPRLFFGITAGNLDSMVANFTANKKPRKKDEYSPGSKPGLRPHRSIIVYANRVREAFHDACIVIGGIEASLRRLAHYDWWDNAVRRSILLDARADILVYGMGESQIVEIARRLDKGVDLSRIRGTVIVRNKIDLFDTIEKVPPYEIVKDNEDKFNEAFASIYRNQDPVRGKAVIQPHGDRFVIQFPPAVPLGVHELDAIYELPFERSPHPSYETKGGIQGFETVKFSIISHRGCCGECNFCSLSMHQGRIVQSRSSGSILREAQLLAQRHDFKGTITDVGGPTANLYMAHCSSWPNKGGCQNKHCLTPDKCQNLQLGYTESVRLYKEILNIPKVKHVFLESGLRHDLLIDNKVSKYLEHLCQNHVSGQMKVAPEHNVRHVLQAMNKPDFEAYEAFVKKYRDINQQIGKNQYLVNYFISAHPGCSLEDTLELALYLAKRKMHPEQIQDFIPLPMTVSGCMYYTEKNPFTRKKIYVSKTFHERKMHRALIQYWYPSNREYVREALKSLDKENLVKLFYGEHKKNSATKREGPRFKN
ncbi:MAG: YgiQ family radical protein [Deltaproteobacteria bacterium]|nr:YgiQ family radical protein [Deltaproteobacteria bacterium]